LEVPVENEDVDKSDIKRKSKENSEQSSKKQKTNDENGNIQDDSNQAVPSNPRFEWYDEIKRALSKATDQTLDLDTLKKKVISRKTKRNSLIKIIDEFSWLFLLDF